MNADIMNLVTPCIENGVMHIERTKDKILALFEEIIHAIDMKGLFKNDTNHIQTVINNVNTTIQVHIDNGVLMSIDGYTGFSNRVWTNTIKW